MITKEVKSKDDLIAEMKSTNNMIDFYGIGNYIKLNLKKYSLVDLQEMAAIYKQEVKRFL